MRLSGAVICTGFADLAEITLPANRDHLDDLLVITTPDDHDTIRLCHKLHIGHLADPNLAPYSGIAKAHAINRALRILKHRARHRTLTDWRGWRNWWFLQHDADIVLPAHTRPTLQSLRLDRRTLYGIDREGMKPDVWARRGIPGPKGNLVSFAPRGVWRVGHDEGSGSLHWWPLGYFQLWNPQASHVWAYPTTLALEGLPNRTTDRELAALFPRHRRADIPELICAHLLAGDARPGADWQGRVTSRFVAPPDRGGGYAQEAAA